MVRSGPSRAFPPEPPIILTTDEATLRLLWVAVFEARILNVDCSVISRRAVAPV